MITDWVEIAVTATSETEETIANVLCELGSNGVVIADSEQTDGIIVSGYIPAGERIQDKLQSIRTLWAELCDLGLATGSCQIEVQSIPASDWTTGWQARFSPVHISDRLVITPPWASVPAKDGRIVIEIAPGLAFGTGEHETTKLCLQMLQQHIQAGDRVLDVGTGSGILSISSVLLGAQEVVAIEVDDVAVESARENIRRNGVEDKIGVYHGSIDHPSVTGLFRVIASNTDTRTLRSLLTSLHRMLDTKGVLLLSGVLKEERDSLVQFLEAHAFKLIHDEPLGEWWGGVAVTYPA